jgi:hypothetical protein
MLCLARTHQPTIGETLLAHSTNTGSRGKPHQKDKWKLGSALVVGASICLARLSTGSTNPQQQKPTKTPSRCRHKTITNANNHRIYNKQALSNSKA